MVYRAFRSTPQLSGPQSMDLPTGPTIVCIFGLLLAASGALAYLQHRRERGEQS
ncbi:MAG: hypothetical protein QG573_2145 [Acidobacteriota bacterium]|nr:hypothetical protein [Acidobacteriota bacterium]